MARRLTKQASSSFFSSSTSSRIAAKNKELEDSVPTDPEFQRHLAGEDGNVKKALKRWRKTLQWREDNQVDGILDRPYPAFSKIKRYYPQYYCGRTKEGRLLYIERLTEVNIKALKELGLGIDDLIRHYIYVAEYQYKFLADGNEDGKSVTILDVKGLKFSQVIGDTIAFAKKATKIAQDHYPERAHKIYIINVPLWFDTVFKLVKPILAPETLQKIRIFRHRGFTKELLQDVDEDVLPARYGGKNKLGDYENPLEEDLLKFVQEHIDDAGKVME